MKGLSAGLRQEIKEPWHKALRRSQLAFFKGARAEICPVDAAKFGSFL